MNVKTQKTLFNENLDKAKKELKEEDVQEKFFLLLEHEKVIRDSVWGDIWITKTESDIIDKPIFQRLRGIKQLGPTDLVYLGAKHTRFEHSLGTLYMAQQIIDSVNKNSSFKLPSIALSAEDIFITRIVALIHDLAHLPYGHTIEDEGNLFGENKQWLDEDRRKKILKDVLPVVERHLHGKGIPQDRNKKIQEEIESILIAEERGEDEIHKLDRPYIADIVGNTICADLLDYLKRDSYNTGLKMVYDPRILSYFVIYPSYENKPRLAILLERRRGKLREDILNYCIDLLRLRYSLAEKVYYHRVKSYFSAMVIEMVYRGLKGGILTKDDLLKLRDDALLYKIISYDKSVKNGDIQADIQACKHLAKALLTRKKYCEIFSASYEKEEIMNKLRHYADPEKRYNLERTLEDLFDLPPGSVIVYSPKLDEGKAAETKIVRGIFERSPIIKKLKEMGKEPAFASTIGQEIEILSHRYRRLWRFYVLVDSDYSEYKGVNLDLLKRACEEVILKNKVEEAIIRIRARLNKMDLTDSEIDNAVKIIVEMDPREIKGGKIDEILNSIKEIPHRG
jgi:HD superfamily phosphohydrolase